MDAGEVGSDYEGADEATRTILEQCAQARFDVVRAWHARPQVWGPGPTDAQGIIIDGLSDSGGKYPNADLGVPVWTATMARSGRMSLLLAAPTGLSL